MKTDNENIIPVTGFAPDTSPQTDDLEAIIDDGSSGVRGLSVQGIPATVIGCVAPPDLHASDAEWLTWIDSFLRP